MEHGLLTAELKLTPTEEDAKSDSLYPLAVSAGPVAHVVHARDRRGGVPERAARLGHINVAHYARPIVLLLLLVFPVVFGAGSDDANGKVPIFSGTPTDFHPWFILFSAYVAWKLTEASDILSGHESSQPGLLCLHQSVLPPRLVAPLLSPTRLQSVKPRRPLRRGTLITGSSTALLSMLCLIDGLRTSLHLQ